MRKTFKILVFAILIGIFSTYIANTAYKYFSNQSFAEKYALANLKFKKSILEQKVAIPMFFHGAYFAIMHSNNQIDEKQKLSDDIYISFAQTLKIRKQKQYPLDVTIAKLQKIDNTLVRENIANQLMYMAIFAKDYDAAISVMNYARKDYEWFTILIYAYYNSEKKDFHVHDKLISKNLRHFRTKTDLPPKEVWNMVCSMPHLLVGGYYKSSSETAIYAFDDYKRFKNIHVFDFSKSINQFYKDYKSRRTSESAKVLSGLLYLAEKKDKALEIIEQINNPTAKINAICLLINLAVFNDDIATAEMLAEKITTFNKIKIYFFL